MVKKLIGVLAGTVLALSVVGVAAAGASANPPGKATIQVDPGMPPHSAVVNTATPAGTVGPLYGVEYCSTSTVATWTTKKCIELVSTRLLYLYASKTAGPTFSGHQNFSGNGFTTNTPPGTYGTNTYLYTGAFGNATYCNTLWKHNSTGSYRNMGSVCT